MELICAVKRYGDRLVCVGPDTVTPSDTARGRPYHLYLGVVYDDNRNWTVVDSHEYNESLFTGILKNVTWNQYLENLEGHETDDRYTADIPIPNHMHTVDGRTAESPLPSRYRRPKVFNIGLSESPVDMELPGDVSDDLILKVNDPTNR